MTEKLYYKDSHIHEFEATVIGCEERKGGYAVILDRSAFFPEGGGQQGDSGYIAGVRVSDTHEKEGALHHYTESPLAVGEAVSCRIDYEQRRRRMQNHSGEHIVSGITNRLHGYNNVGFHMGEDCMTIDFDGELTWEQLMEIESLANQAVRDNIPVQVSFPDAETLAALDYRSKLELTEDVRIVEIEGIDRCACCAPHVSMTGEVGIIKVMDAERHRGGVRISLVCGMDALDDYRKKQENAAAVSNLLSVKRNDIAKGVERILNEQAKLKERLAAVNMEYVKLKAESFAETSGNICVFDNAVDDVALRELVNLLMEKCSLAAAFSGSDSEGYRYIIGSKNIDLRANSKTINAGISGKGGGSKEMIQGRAGGSAEEIRAFIEKM